MDVVGGFYKKNWGELFSNTGIRWFFDVGKVLDFSRVHIYIYVSY